MKLVFHIAIFLLLASCRDNVRVKTTGVSKSKLANGFTIDSPANLTTKDTYQLKWSELAEDLTYDVTIAKDAACTDVVAEKKGITEQSLNLDFLNDGAYYLCVEAINKTEKYKAKNNGIYLVIDKTQPEVSIPKDTMTYHEAFNPTLEIADLSTVTIAWSDVSKTGGIKILSPNSLSPRISAKEDGIYKVKATITDKAGNKVEQIYQFAWDTSGPNITLNPTLVTSQPKSPEFTLDTSVVKVAWSFTGGPTGGKVNFAAGPNANTPLLSATMDGTYKVILNAYDKAENASSASMDFTWDTVPPVFQSLALTGPASDGYLSAADHAMSASIVGSLNADGYDKVRFKLVSAAASCTDPSNYTETAPRSNSTVLIADGPYKVCAALSDASGLVTYGASTPVVLDTSPAIFTSIALVGDAIDGTINSSERTLSNDLVGNLVSSDATTQEYALVGGSVSCAGPLSYSTSIPKSNDSRFTVPGAYKVCVRLTDAAQNTPAIGSSVPFNLVLSGPVFTSLTPTAEAVDGFINASENASTQTGWSLFAAQYSTASYSVAQLDPSSSITCNASQTYSLTSIPGLNTLTSDGRWIICAKLVDAAGTTVYGKSLAIVRNTAGPTFTSLAGANDASDGYINNSEKTNLSDLWTLSGTTYTTASYTTALSDTAGALVCDASKTYNQTTLPQNSALSADGAYGVCVKLLDAAGNSVFGKSVQVVRDTLSPTFTSLLGANAAADGVVSSSDAASTSDLLVLSASGYTNAAYTLALDETVPVSCDAARTYSANAVPKINDLASDKSYAVCVKLSDAAGNTVYGKSQVIVRTTTGPVFTSLVLAAEATDAYINDSEKAANNPLWTLSSSGATSTLFTAALSDTGGTLVCNNSRFYNQASPAVASSISSDGAYSICVKLSDASGNITYGKGQALTRDIVTPSFTSLALANAATDGYINNSEKLLVSDLWTLTASGQTTAAYTLPLDDTGGLVSCTGSQTYNQSMATPAGLGSDGLFAICVKLSDAAGNSSYGKSVQVTRDIVGPTFTSLNGANEASDAYINGSEIGSSSPLFTLVASGQAAAAYTLALSDNPSITCDVSKTYGQSSLPAVNALSSDGAYAACVKLTDAAGNITYGKSQSIQRTTTGPTFTSLVKAGVGSDGFVNDSEKANSGALWTLSASGATTTAYSSALSDTAGALNCNSGRTYDQGTTVANAASLASDGTWNICVKLSDVAGNVTYGKGEAIERDIVAPTFTSLALANVASDAYVNDSEKLSPAALWTLTASGHSSAAYTLASSDTAGALVCDNSNTYGQSSIAAASSLGADGAYSLCVKLSDAAGNPSYGKAVQLTRDIVGPTFTSLNGANGASDLLIVAGEQSSTLALYALVASGQSTSAFTVPLSDDPSAAVCDVAQTYDQASIPGINTISSDGKYAVCAKLTDTAGNITYGKSQRVERDINPPTFTSLSAANGASDGYINNSEKTSGSAAWALVASGQSTTAYTLALDDTAGAVVCDVSQTYGQASIPVISALSSDGSYAICVKLSDSSGNIVYGKSQQIVRDTAAPAFTSLNGANGASDGYINDSEKASSAALLSLVASGQSSTAYTVALDNTPAVTCDGAQSYGQASVPAISDLSSDESYAVCVKLSDAAGNTTYAQSQTIVRLTATPTMTSLVKAAEGSDGYINDSEKAATNALWTLTAPGISLIDYTTALSDTAGALVCDNSQTYGQGTTIARATDLASDGAYSICVKLTDAAGNVGYGKGQQITRDIVQPTFTSLARANAASDGFVNDSEKLLTSALMALTASGHATAAYTPAADDTGAALTCTSSNTYDQASIPTPATLSSDGTFAICVKLTDAAGNINYGKSAQFVRDIAAPTFTSLNGANQASDGYIKTGEENSGSALFTLIASGQSSTDYTVALSDDPVITCNAAKTYDQAAIAVISALSTDGKYALCVKLSDAAGNVTYAKSQQIERDIDAPVFTSLLGANGGSDGYIKDTEKASTSAAWALIGSGHSVAAYSLPLDDTAAAVVCDVSVTYGQSSIPQISAIASDGPWAICAKLSDAAGNITYGKSQQLIRDVVYPTFTSLIGANEAADGAINIAEAASNLALLTLSASGYSAINYTLALDDTPAVTCDGSQTYSLNAIPSIDDLGGDESYAVCAELVDLAGNTTYGKSQQIVKITGAPTFTSLAKGAEGSDGYINDSEKSATNVLWTLTASGYTSLDYSAPLSDAGGAQVCNAADTYDQGTTIPTAAGLTSDGAWTICVRLTDGANNHTYGKAQQIVRDVAPPSLTSLALSGAASDGYIKDSEKLLVSAMWTLTAVGQASAMYTVALDDTAAGVTCNAAKTYDQASIATPASLASDAPYAICVKLTDDAGNIAYGKSAQVIRDIVAPTFTSMVGANGASDLYIKSGEEASGSALYTLTASGYSADDFTAALSDDPTPVTCDGSQTYGQANIPAISSISSDGKYAVCVQLSDAAGNVTYGKGQQIERDVTAPTFTSLNAANGASDGYVNDSEKGSTAAAWTLNAAGHTAIDYTVPLDDTVSVTCNAGKTYDQTSIPHIDAMTSDAPWVICAKLTDAAGNTSYGKSQQIIRDIAAPTFTSLNGANGASDGYISNAEAASTSALLTLSASGQATTAYTLALDDTTPVTCDGLQTYGQSAVPAINDLTTDKAYAVCVKLTDTAGNTAYGKSQVITKDTAAPSFTSLVKAAEGADGYIIDSEKAATTALWTLSGSAYSAAAYTTALDDTAAGLTCNAAKTYDQGTTIAGASGLTSDGAWSICVKLTDAAGNIAYGKGEQITRDITGPTFTSLALANAAADGYINDAEKGLTTALWSLTASGQTATDYTTALSDTAGALACNNSRTYDQTTIADPSSLSADGAYSLCVRLTDAAGNITYGKAVQITRDIVAPTFTSLDGANGASDLFIKSGEENATSALFALTASGHSADDFTVVLSDFPVAISCNSGKTYDQTSIPQIDSIASDGKYAVCVKLTDAAGNISYGKSQQIERDIAPPTLTSLNGANGASDGYVNDSEKASTAAAWDLVAAGQASVAYTLPLDDTGASVTCTVAKTYDQASIAQIDGLTSDKPWVICVRLTDAAGNIAYGKSAQVIRDIVAPTFTSLNGANGASDAYINGSEAASSSALLTLVASGQSSSNYTLALDDTTPVTCDVSKTYNQSAVPAISDLASDKPWAVCAKLVDAAGNISYGKSEVITRDTVDPTFTSLVKAAEGADGYINDSEKAQTTALWTLSASGQTTTAYSLALTDAAGAQVCDSGDTYGQGTTVAGASGLTSDGAWTICVKLSDAAGNITYGKGDQITRDIVAPTFTSLLGANGASDGYVNDAEKASTSLAWTLSASGQTATAYTLALDDSSTVTCNSGKTYGQATVPQIDALTSDLPWIICVRLTDTAGNIAYGKSAQVVRDIVYPVFTSLVGANEANDLFIKSGEEASSSALFTLSGSGYASDDFTVALDDTAAGVVCDSGKTYSNANVPLVSSVASDGLWAVCAKITDAAGNASYGKSQQIERDITPPTFTSLLGANGASDGYVNDAEKASTSLGWALIASGQSAATYTVPLDDATPVTCNVAKTYDQATIPQIDAMSSDTTWAVCAKLVDAAGNITYGKSQVITRDIVGPTFTSLLGANGASDAYINSSEAASGSALLALIASGQATTDYTLALDDTTPVTCDVSKTYNQSAVPAISDLTTDKNYAVCVKLTDAAGNITYGKSQVIVKDTAAPTFTSLVKAAQGSDGYINDSEKAQTTALWTLSASGQTTTAYSLALSDTGGAQVCDSGDTYGQGTTVAGASGLTSDGAWTICVKLTDAAGNITYGKGDQIVRDIVSPVFTSLAASGAASDSYINDSEKLTTSAMWTLSASGQSTTDYSAALSDTSGAQVCDVSDTYDQASIAIPSSLSSDGAYALCVRLTDDAGNITYGKSDQITRDIVFPVLTSLNGANEASDLYIKSGEQSSALAAYAIVATGHTSDDFTVALDDATPITCDSGKTYSNASIPLINTIASDGVWAVCVKLADAAGNHTYGKSQQITRDIVAPSFTSLLGANGASDGYVNDSEKASTSLGWALIGTGYTIDDFTVPLDDTTPVTCDGNKTYSSATIPQIDAMTSDKTWAVCARISDAAGNVAYGKSQVITRDIVAPVFTSLNGLNGASDGYISSAEAASGLAMLSLSASGQTSTNYTLALDDTTPVTCDVAQTYGQSAVPNISDLGTDKNYAVCVKLADTAGNITYGKSEVIVKDTSAPSFTSLAKAAQGSDGYINDSEKAQTTAIWTLTASGQSTTAYTVALSDTGGAQVCDVSDSYNQGTTVPGASGLGSDGAWTLCVKLTDAAGNITYGKGDQITRDIVYPTFTSLTVLNAASDGYINDSEKLLTNAMWSLSASGQTATDYTAALSDTSGAQVCDSGDSYNQGTTVAIPSSLSSDGAYALCVRLTDAAGNITYGKSDQITRDIVFPVFGSLAAANEASDGYIKSGEESAATALYAIAGSSGYTVDDFTAALDDSVAITCNSGKTYSNGSIPLINSISSDGTYAVCARLADAAGNNTYGKSAQVIRGITPPTFTSLSATSVAADGYIAYGERNSATAAWALNATGHTSANYTVALDDTSSAVVCNAAKTYSSSSIPLVSSIATDGPWVACVKLTDAAGNITYGKSQQIIRDIVAPGAPSGFAATAGNRYIDLKWTASTGSLTGYLVVRGPAGSAPTFAPSDGTSYSVGAQGVDEIIAIGTSTLVLDNLLTLNATYSYKVYAVDVTLNYSAAASASATPVSPCASNFVFVAGDPDYGTNDFCVMKYEAKSSSGVATSQASSTPWVSITLHTAKTECGKLGLKYNLIDNDQYMTLASSIAGIGSNWTGASVGSGTLIEGHTDANPNSVCAASANDTLNLVETDCTAVSTGDAADQRRTYNLANNEIIWDFSGNPMEWTNYGNLNDKPNANYSWYEYTAVTGTPTTPLRQLVPTHAVKSYWDDTWDDTDGIGQFYPGPNGTNTGMPRGGQFNGGNTGLFSAALSRDAYGPSGDTGFRCVQGVTDFDPAALSLVAGDSQIAASWTTVGGASGYILVRGPAGSLPTFQPLNGTSYSAGSQGSDTIVYSGASLTYTNTGLENNVVYNYALYSWSGSNVYATPVRAKDTPLACPTGFVVVPGDTDYGIDDFCVMKYEAKSIGGVATSITAMSPWINLSMSDAITACSAMGPSYQLISNPEWMTVAANAAARTSNWSSGTVGTGNMFQGHADSNPNYACPASDNDSYAYVENNCTPRASGQGEDAETSQRRTITLSNGKVVWDFAGNEWEYVSYYNLSDRPIVGAYADYTSVTGTTAMPLKYLVPTNAVKSFWTDSWTGTTQFAGKYYGGTSGTQGVLIRGGNYGAAAVSGLFAAKTDISDTSGAWGFRCTLRGLKLNTPKNFAASPSGGTTVSLSWASGGSSTAGYLLVRGQAGQLPVFQPANGTTYTAGTQGNDSVIYVGVGKSKLDTGLTAGANYNYRLYAYDSSNTYSSAALQSVSVTPCPENYVFVPGDSDYGTTDFCMMKYEAGNDGGSVAVSKNTLTPWISIKEEDASTRCTALGSDYHISTNDEWMTAASNIASVGANWTNGTVGSGLMFIGHSDSSPASVCAPSSDDSLIYVETTCTAVNTGDTAEQKRVFELSNGLKVWDFSGNVAEFNSYFNAVGKATPLTSANTNYTSVTGVATMPLRFLIPTNAVKSYWNDTWNATQGVGQYFSNANAAGGGMIRGAAYNDGTTVGGIFRARMSINAVTTSTTTGFRCVKSLSDTDSSTLTLIPTSGTQITASWTSTSATGYMLVTGAAGSEPTFTPDDGTSYAAGAQGSDTVLYDGTALTYSHTSLTAGTKYHYALYSYDASDNYTLLARNYERPIACPSNYVLVAGDADYGTQDFCVMKYEASNSSSVPTSAAGVAQWTAISQESARARCTALGAGYDLINNPEWMTMGANIASLSTNWTGAAVGTGTLMIGNTDGSPGSACAASANDTLYYVESNCTAVGTGDTTDQRRTLNLSTGGVVWDVSGNNWDLVHYSNSFDKPLHTATLYEYTAVVNTPTLQVRNLIPTNTVKSYWVNTWNSSKGIGQYYPEVNGQGGLMYRGGSHNYGSSHAGVFGLTFEDPAQWTSGSGYIGFRCVKHP